MNKSIFISNLTYLLVAAGIDPLNYMDEIPIKCFYMCDDLVSIEIPNNITSINDSAFDGCSGLKSVTIGNSVTSIGEWAFFDCSGLTSVTIPDSVASIGKWAFYGCSSLKYIDYLGTKKQWNNLLKYTNSIPKSCIIHCSDGDINL